MAQLKIGQRYRVTNPDNNPTRLAMKDRVGKVIEVSGTFVMLDILHGWNWGQEELTLMENTMENLQAGDFIYDDDGDKRKVLARVDELIAIGGYSSSIDTYEGWYSVSELIDDGFKLTKYGSDEVKEMTVAEITEELGYEVKVVKD